MGTFSDSGVEVTDIPMFMKPSNSVGTLTESGEQIAQPHRKTHLMTDVHRTLRVLLTPAEVLAGSCFLLLFFPGVGE